MNDLQYYILMFYSIYILYMFIVLGNCETNRFIGLSPVDAT